MVHTPTVTAQFSLAVQQEARRIGLHTPGVCTSDRVSLAEQDGLWQQFWDGAHDPLIGVELGLRLEIGSLDVAGLVLMSCASVGEALQALMKYAPIIGEGSHFRLERAGNAERLCYDPVYAVCRAPRVEATMVSLIHLMSWGTGGLFRTDALSFCHTPQTQADRYRVRLGLPVAFGCADNAIVFRLDQLHTPLLHANPSLCAHLRAHADDLLERLDRRAVNTQVEALVAAHPRWGKERVAAELGISGRQLARKLADEDTTFKTIRCQLLRRRAERALDAGWRPTRVADQLGFPDETAFAKAFKRWTRSTPSQYQKRTGRSAV